MDQTNGATAGPTTDPAIDLSFDKPSPPTPLPPIGADGPFPAYAEALDPDPEWPADGRSGADGYQDHLAAPAHPRFRMQRSRRNRMIAGVCGGLADGLGVDVSLLRIGLVALTVLGAGAGIVIYVAAWILAPEADAAA